MKSWSFEGNKGGNRGQCEALPAVQDKPTKAKAPGPKPLQVDGVQPDS